MKLLRSRHEELDPLRTVYAGFNHSWLLFFGTQPPGLSKHAVRYTAEEKKVVAGSMQTFADGARSTYVEAYDPVGHNRGRLADLYGGR